MGAGFHGGFGGTHGAGENHKDYIENTLPKSSPIKIPSSATVKEEQKNGYDQVKYTWKKGDYSYTSRWHTRTPNAPKEQGDSWVVQRDKAGIVTVKMHVLPSTRYLLVKTSGYQKRNGRRLSVQGKTEQRQKSKRRC